MSKVTIQIGFYLDGQHYAQMQAYLPKTQAIKIPQLKAQQKINKIQTQQSKPQRKPGRIPKNQQCKSQKSESKKVQSQQQIIQQQEQNPNEIQNEEQEQQQQQQDNLMEDEQDQQKIDSQKQQQNLIRYLQEQDDSDDDDLDDEDLSSISRSMSVMRNNHKTKRQKGDRAGLTELPDRRPRKDKKLDQATQVIRRQQKQRKRKQYLKKQVEAQQKATLDKILNQTGRKLKLREQKQNEDQKKKQQKQLKNVSDEPRIITIENKQGSLIMLHKTNLFSQQMTRQPQVKIKASCNKCGIQDGRYRIKNTNKVACSLNCYKLLV